LLGHIVLLSLLRLLLSGRFLLWFWWKTAHRHGSAIGHLLPALELNPQP
jgi:hypothetical protein